MKLADQKVSILFDKLMVNSIDAASAIFFGGTNVANGWSSHSKSNNGFGQSSQSHHTSLSVIYDQDVIDAPIDDRDHFIIANEKNRATSSQISLEDIQVNALEANSSISIGEVSQEGWSSHFKTNSGQGSHKGVNISEGGQSTIVDNDVVDAPIKSNRLIQRVE